MMQKSLQVAVAFVAAGAFSSLGSHATSLQASSILLARQAAGEIDYTAAPPNLTTLSNGSLFNTWRPKAHVLPPDGHTGDPTGHWYDDRSGLFHVGYLYNNPNETQFGVASATTADFVTWTDIRPGTNDQRYIQPGGKNDPLAVFDGTVISRGYQGLPTFIYTSVSYLPISWTVDYTRGSETQSIAVSMDATGRNFTKLQRGPVIPAAPFGLDVTGWRDPFEFQDAQFDELTGSQEGTYYLLISGGVHDVGSAQFLYRQYKPEYDFEQWEYLGRYWKEDVNATWGNGLWAGRWGFNFEVANIVRLDTEGESKDGDLFSIVCSEGGKYGIQGGRAQLWAAGNLKKNNLQCGTEDRSCISNKQDQDLLSFDVNMAGILDWGSSAYAAAGKILPASSLASQGSGAPNRYIAWVWLTGNFFGTLDWPVAQQGWDSGLLTPRELYIESIENVVNNDAVKEVGSWRVSQKNDDADTVTLQTLGQKPVREALTAFKFQASASYTEPARKLSGSANTSTVAFTQSPTSRNYVLEASLSFRDKARSAQGVKAGFQIYGSDFEKTDIYYQFSNETLIIDRTESTAVAATTDGIDTRNEAGRHRLWDIRGQDGQTRMESLDLRIIVDNSFVEVYANNRFVMSTLLLPWYEFSNAISFFVEGPEEVSFSDVQIWEGLVDAWPQRNN